ncbi:MAG: mercuric reductase [Leptolyngbyaceae bacterium]|nr:mercuric reductase [Leptolyngbyaceae bacterium]
MTFSSTHSFELSPMDEFNQQLIDNVHPPDWKNPMPKDEYDLVVIGAGTAGLVAAKGAGGLGIGLKVALIERSLLGGDCLNVGCVPSKAVIRSSRVAADLRRTKPFGIHPPERVDVDFAAVMRRMRRVRAQISPVDSPMSAQKVGVDVFLGDGSFIDDSSISVAGKTLRFKKAVIATGARAVSPKVEGLKDAGFLTNETVFNLTECPGRLAVIGGGPIGCELAQAFRRLGSEVFLFERSNHVLVREDSDAAEIVQKAFIHEGIQLVLNSSLKRVEKTPEGKRLYFERDGKEESIVVDDILVGAGRQPNVDGLNLEAAGVDYDARRGVRVDDHLQTSNPRIFAAGDICMNWKFTHAADAAARIVLKNAFFSPFGFGKYKLSDLVMPWATYTDPEIAHVGLYEHEAQEKGMDVNTIKVPFHDVDRAIADGEEEGFVKILHKRGSDEILGATIVATHAGDMISEITTAIVGGLGLSKLSSVIHPYPTQAEAIKKAADGYRRTLLTDRAKFFLSILTKFS